MDSIKLTPSEMQSGSSRQKFAEGLIAQLPLDHDGRNTWLMNYGVGEEAQQLRKSRHLPFDDEYGAVVPHMHVAGTQAGLHIDTCARCGCDIRSEIHSGSRTVLPPLLAGEGK